MNFPCDFSYENLLVYNYFEVIYSENHYYALKCLQLWKPIDRCFLMNSVCHDQLHVNNRTFQNNAHSVVSFLQTSECPHQNQFPGKT